MLHQFYAHFAVIFALISSFLNCEHRALADNAGDSSKEREFPPLVLAQGEQRLLHEPGLARYSLGGPQVRAHRLATQESLLLKAITPGVADLWVWKRDGGSEHRLIRVEKSFVSGLVAGLEKALGRLEQTEVLFAGSGVVLRGPVTSTRESAQIQAIKERFSQEVRDETEPSPEFLKTSEKKLNNWLVGTPLAKNLKLEREGTALFVRGSLERPALQTVAEKALRQIFPQVSLELNTMPDSAPTVYFRVFLLELKKNRFRSLGLSWPAFQEAAFRVTSSAIMDALSLDVTLNTLEGDGSLRILSNPELVVRAPGEAELFAGGELPIHAKSQYFSNVSWKAYGLSLRLKVTQSVGDRVRLEIFTEVSHLDPSISQESLPGIQANRMKTQVDARYGTPLLLSGLLQQNIREQAKGLPLLRNIPVLGSLFGSEDYLNERSELVAILLPASAPPSHPLDRLTRVTPRGSVPVPRDWLSPDKERALKESPDWPWNALL